MMTTNKVDGEVDNDDDYILGAQDVLSLKYLYVELRNIEPQVHGNFSQFLYF